ncbi:MAG: PAS domain-containing sensor histidine kinase [Bacteroidota bacterium]
MNDNFRQSMDDAPIGMRIVSQEGNTIYANQAILDYYGYESLEELQKTPLKKRYTPQSYAQAQIRKQQRDRGDFSATDYKVSIVRKDGGIRHLQVIRKSVLWDGSGQFLIICSDITRRTLAEEALIKQNRALLELNRFSVGLSDLSSTDHPEAFIAKKLKEITCAEATVFSEYDASNHTMKVRHVEMESGLIEKVVGLLGKQVKKIRFAISDKIYQEMIRERIGMRKTLYSASFKAIPRTVGAAIQTLLKVNRFIGVSYAFEGKLHGISLLAMSRDQPDPPPEILKNFIHLATAFLERREREEAISSMQKSLELLNNRLVDIREEERASISREIHDQLGQSLTALKIDIDILSRKMAGNLKESSILKGMEELIISTIKDVQRISFELHPAMLDDLGLVAAIEWYCGVFRKRTGIDFNIRAEDFQFPDQRRSLVCYRIVQEALTNVARHANAKNVSVNLLRAEDSIILEITDNGTGFETEKIDAHTSLGFIGMRERLKQYNGWLDVSSILTKGTTLRISMPLQ